MFMFPLVSMAFWILNNINCSNCSSIYIGISYFWFYVLCHGKSYRSLPCMWSCEVHLLRHRMEMH